MRTAAVRIKGNSGKKAMPQLLWKVKQESGKVSVVGKREGGAGVQAPT